MAERGEAGVTRIKDLTDARRRRSPFWSASAHRVDATGDPPCSRGPGRSIGYVWRAARRDLRRPGDVLRAAAHARRTGAPSSASCLHLIGRVLAGKIQPGKVFDLKLPLSDVAEDNAPWTNDARSKTLMHLLRWGDVSRRNERGGDGSGEAAYREIPQHEIDVMQLRPCRAVQLGVDQHASEASIAAWSPRCWRLPARAEAASTDALSERSPPPDQAVTAW